MSHPQTLFSPLIEKLPLSRGPLCIRLLEVDDLGAFISYRRDPVVAKYQSWSEMTESEAQAFLMEMGSLGQEWRIGEWIQLGISFSETRSLVGDLGLLREDSETVQIGITLAQAVQGRGLAKTAVSEITNALKECGFKTLRAVIETRNTKSINLFKNLKFIEKDRIIYDKENKYEEFIMELEINQ